MSIPLENILVDFSAGPPALKKDIEVVENCLAFRFPLDYRDFILQYNGGEGFIGKHFLVLWKIEELVDFNKNYQVATYAPGFVAFGSTGGGDGLVFDTRTDPYRIVQVPFIGISLEDGFFVAENFRTLLKRMFETEGALF